MSLVLALGTKPAGLQVKTFGFGPHTIYLGKYEISLKDFLAAAEYVLINRDLDPNDPRLEFIELVKSMREVPWYQEGNKRLE